MTHKLRPGHVPTPLDVTVQLGPALLSTGRLVLWWKVVAPAAGRGAVRWDGELVAPGVERRPRLFVSWLPVEVGQRESVQQQRVGVGIERTELEKQLCHPAALLFVGLRQPGHCLVGQSVGLGVGIEEVVVLGGEQLSCTFP